VTCFKAKFPHFRGMAHSSDVLDSKVLLVSGVSLFLLPRSGYPHITSLDGETKSETVCDLEFGK